MERQTRQRVLLREVFLAQNRPLSATEALFEARRAHPALGQATAYRVIREFVQEGFLQEVVLPGQFKRYEIANQAHHHYFQCNACEKVFGIEGCPGNMPEIVPPGFQLESHEVILYGTCCSCN